MMRSMMIAVSLVVISGAAQAANEWGIEYEEKARFEATVVDVLCELSGDCPDDCGGGRRQLGLLTDEGALILPVKNQDIFAGAASDLIEYCGKKIVVDGLLIKDPQMTLFAIQFKRLAPDGEWSRASWFIRDWAEKNGVARDSAEAKQWFRNDGQVKTLIESEGVYGIPGLEPEE